MNTASDDKRALLRHTVATLAYRGEKTLRSAPTTFSAFRISNTARTPLEILAHIGDLLDWGLSLAKGENRWNASPARSWESEMPRFFEGLKQFDDYLASAAPLKSPAEKLFQGPIADAFAHFGQIAMLRRAAGAPIRAENYFKAEIIAGRVGPDQSAKRLEFD
jgi:hypothetical protein